MEAFITENKPRIGLVSLEAPLLSNLHVKGNIAMIKEYHQNLPRREAEILALQHLQRYGMEDTADKRGSALTNRERFCVMLLRAAMLEGAIILIDRPFTIAPDIKDASFIEEAIKRIDDLFAQCHIFDYTWNKERYRNG